VNIRDGYWTEVADGWRVSRGLRRTLPQAAIARSTHRALRPVVRVRSGLFLTTNDKSDSAELLRVLAREEL
jgi:hypothetical protein